MEKDCVICYNSPITYLWKPKNSRKDDFMKKLAVPARKVCVACGVCVKACPKGAISIYKGCFACVDEEKCVGCGLCARACPAGCIETKERSQAK